MMGRIIDIEGYVYNRTFFNVISKGSNTPERSLQIDVFRFRESYKRGELKKLEWIPGTENAADVLIKEVLSKKSAMWKLMTTYKVEMEHIGCLSRNAKENESWKIMASGVVVTRKVL